LTFNNILSFFYKDFSIIPPVLKERRASCKELIRPEALMGSVELAFETSTNFTATVSLSAIVFYQFSFCHRQILSL
jgi:predicted transcriptional regulator